MPPRPSNLEERDRSERLVLSMRTKLSIGGLCFFTVIVLLAYTTTPYVATALRSLGQPGVEGPGNESIQEKDPGNESIQGNPDEEVYVRVTGALIVATDFGLGSSTSRVYLYNYADGYPVELWSTELEGGVMSASLLDLDADDIPEIVVGTQRSRSPYGTHGSQSLQIFKRSTYDYELIFKFTVAPTDADIARGRMIDYYDNGSRQLLAMLDDNLLLIGSKSGVPFITEYLGRVGSYGFDVADVDGDGRVDIFHSKSATEDRFGLIENMGNGEYVKRNIEGPRPWPIDEIRTGDVDGDGDSEIVMVGLGAYGNPVMSVYDYRNGSYIPIWILNNSVLESAIQCVDLGDIDRDGILEIGTGSGKYAGEGLAIWEFNETDGSFYPKWRDTTLSSVEQMLSLRIGPVDKTGSGRLLGLGTGKLYVVGYELGELKYRGINLHGSSMDYESIDLWILTADGMSRDELESLSVSVRSRASSLDDGILREMLLDCCDKTDMYFADDQIKDAGDLITLANDVLILLENPPADIDSILHSVRDYAEWMGEQGYLFDMLTCLETGYKIVNILENVDDIHGGVLLVDQLYEAAELLNQSPTSALGIAEWCNRSDVLAMASRIQGYEDDWDNLVSGVPERDGRILKGMLDSAKRKFAVRDLKSTEAGLVTFLDRLGQLGVEVAEPCLSVICILLFMMGIHGSKTHNSKRDLP